MINGDKIINKGLSYLIKPNEVYFYYNDKLIFMNSKSIPFITIKIKNEDLIKEISLSRFNIEKISINKFKITFYDSLYSVVCFISYKNNVVSFEIHNENNYYEVCFTLYKENKQKVYGLYTYKNVKQKFSIKRFIKELFNRDLKMPFLTVDKKLAFYIKENYFFENKNIYDYSIDITDNIYIRVKQKEIYFNLVYSQNINIAINQENKNSEKITKFDEVKNFILTEKLNYQNLLNYQKKNKIKIHGIIIKANNYNLSDIKVLQRTCNKKKLILVYTLDIDYNLSFFNEDELILVNEKYRPDLSKEEVIRKYRNVIRKYLDLNIDGIYIDGDYNKAEISIIHNIITEVVKEYYGTIVLHSTISENNDDFGYYILKNEDLIKHFELVHKYYLYSGENRIGREINNICSNKYKFLINIVKN